MVSCVHQNSLQGKRENLKRMFFRLQNKRIDNNQNLNPNSLIFFPSIYLLLSCIIFARYLKSQINLYPFEDKTFLAIKLYLTYVIFSMYSITYFYLAGIGWREIKNLYKIYLSLKCYNSFSLTQNIMNIQWVKFKRYCNIDDI